MWTDESLNLRFGRYDPVLLSERNVDPPPRVDVAAAFASAIFVVADSC